MPSHFAAVAALLLLGASPLLGAELRDLQATVANGHVQVSFQLVEALEPAVMERIQSGLPTAFVYEVELLRDRKRWLDDEIAEATLEVVAMYNAVAEEYLVNFKRDGKLVESRLARSRAELESAMTRFERIPLFPVTDLRGGGRGSRFLLKARAELGAKTWLSFIPVHVATEWAVSRKFRAAER
jgi:hypothetical protein